MTLLKEFAGKAAAEHLMVMCMMRNKVELVPELMMAQLLPDIDLLTAAGEWHAVGAAAQPVGAAGRVQHGAAMETPAGGRVAWATLAT